MKYNTFKIATVPVDDDYDPYFALVVAILKGLNEDYQAAWRTGNKRRIREYEAFVFSARFAKLSDLDPEIFVEYLRRSAQAQKEKGEKRNVDL